MQSPRSESLAGRVAKVGEVGWTGRATSYWTIRIITLIITMTSIIAILEMTTRVQIVIISVAVFTNT